MANPMHQFQVHKIGPKIEISGIDLSFTNASLFMLFSGITITLILFLGTREKKLIPGKMQLMSEMLYSFISKMISDTAGKKAKPYFPFIFSLFIYSYKPHHSYFNIRTIYFRRSNNFGFYHAWF